MVNGLHKPEKDIESPHPPAIPIRRNELASLASLASSASSASSSSSSSPGAYRHFVGSSRSSRQPIPLPFPSLRNQSQSWSGFLPRDCSSTTATTTIHEPEATQIDVDNPSSLSQYYFSSNRNNHHCDNNDIILVESSLVSGDNDDGALSSSVSSSAAFTSLHGEQRRSRSRSRKQLLVVNAEPLTGRKMLYDILKTWEAKCIILFLLLTLVFTTIGVSYVVIVLKVATEATATGATAATSNNVNHTQSPISDTSSSNSYPQHENNNNHINNHSFAIIPIPTVRPSPPAAPTRTKISELPVMTTNNDDNLSTTAHMSSPLSSPSPTLIIETTKKILSLSSQRPGIKVITPSASATPSYIIPTSIHILSSISTAVDIDTAATAIVTVTPTIDMTETKTTKPTFFPTKINETTTDESSSSSSNPYTVPIEIRSLSPSLQATTITTTEISTVPTSSSTAIPTSKQPTQPPTQSPTTFTESIISSVCDLTNGFITFLCQ